MFNPIIKNKIFSKKIYQYLGEITGEYRNKPVCDDQKQEWILPQNDTIVMKLLDKYRDEFNDTNVGYVVFNLVEIIKTARGELSGCDLSRLDLRKININGVICSRSYNFNKKYLAANFSGSKIGVSNIFNIEIPKDIKQISYSNKSDTILLSSDIESIELNNIGVIFNRYDFGNAVYDENDNIIFIRNNKLFILKKEDTRFFNAEGKYHIDFEVETGKHILDIENKKIEKIEYKDKKVLLIYKDKSIEIDIATKSIKGNKKEREIIFDNQEELIVESNFKIDFDDAKKSFVVKKGNETKEKSVNMKNINRNSLKQSKIIKAYSKDKSRLFINFDNITAIEVDVNNTTITRIYQSESYIPYVRTEYDKKNSLLYFTIDDIIKIIYVKINRIEYLMDKIEYTPYKSETVEFLEKLYDKVPLEFILEIIPNTKYRI